MDADRIKWDRKHELAGDVGQPLTLVAEHARLARRGLALDLACGRGRHALLLAELGFEVDAIDISAVALAHFEHPRIHKVALDLDRAELEKGHYDLVVCAYYLDRRLFPTLQASLAPGGILIFETFTETSASPVSSHYKLTPGELETAFGLLQTLSYREQDGIAALVAQRNV